MGEHEKERMSGWERSLVEVVEAEVAHLRELDADQSGDVEPGDVGRVLSRIGALTDLAEVDGLALGDGAKAKLAHLDAEALQVMRDRTARPHSQGPAGEGQQAAAKALFDAILLNQPALAAGEETGFAITISKQAYEDLNRHCGDLDGFSLILSLVRVQDSRAMQLAGDLRK